MNKDKAWAIKGTETNIDLWKSYIGSGEDEYANGRLTGAKEMLSILEQLDEPEVTEEQAWKVIAETYNQSEDYWLDAKNHYIASIQSPVIPQYVADWIQRHSVGNRHTILEKFMCDYTDAELPSPVYNYYNNNVENARDKVIQAILKGYRIRKEQKYCIKLGNMYYESGSEDGEGTFKAELIDSRPKAFTFGSKLDAGVVLAMIGGTIEEWEEWTE